MLNLVSLLQSKDQDLVIYIQKKRIEDILKYVKVRPSIECLDYVRSRIKNECEIDFTVEQILDLLDVFPKYKAGIIMCEGADSSAFDMIAEVLLDSYWPSHGDSVNMDRFKELLQKSARLMGYNVVKEEKKDERNS